LRRRKASDALREGVLRANQVLRFAITAQLVQGDSPHPQVPGERGLHGSGVGIGGRQIDHQRHQAAHPRQVLFDRGLRAEGEDIAQVVVGDLEAAILKRLRLGRPAERLVDEGEVEQNDDARVLQRAAPGLGNREAAAQELVGLL